MSVLYNDRKWLNRPKSPSSGAVIFFDGPVQWASDKPVNRESWVEISDCHSKIRIHRSFEDTETDYIKKILKLKNGLEGYLKHLEAIRKKSLKRG